jgi:predicted transcriptional regulator
MINEERTIVLLLKEYSVGITAEHLSRIGGISITTVRSILYRLERKRLLGAFMKKGRIYYSYNDWNEDKNVTHEKVRLPSEMA